jgi:hypothetical protein
MHQREDRHHLVALVMASLVAGLMLIANLDRATHVSSLTQPQRIVSTSLHGWPLVYLKRELAEPPVVYYPKRLYAWPWPAVEGELRTWKAGNAFGDVGLGLAAVVGAYCLISASVKRYDRWKKTL